MIKNFILKLVFSRLGPSVTSGVSVATGFLLGWIVTGTSALGMHLDAAQQTTVSLAISQTIYWLITELVNKYSGEHASAVQAALKKVVPDLKIDNWIGSETVAAAQATAQAAATNASASDPEIYQGVPVFQEREEHKQAKIQPKRKKHINPLRK